MTANQGDRAPVRRAVEALAGRRWLMLAVALIGIAAVVAAGAALLQPGLSRPYSAARSVAPPPTPTQEADPPLRIMPLGDSITDGIPDHPGGTAGAYRSDLWQLLTASGNNADFVGSQSNGPATLLDQDHEGHGGWRIEQLAEGVRSGWLQQSRPDIVLLHIGTNNMYSDEDADAAPAALSGLLDDISAALPGVRVLVATIIGSDLPDAEPRIEAYNAAIPAILAEKTAAGANVELVDMHSVLESADRFDGLHPTGGGYSKMAARWFEALTGRVLVRWEAEDPAVATPYGAVVIETRSASGGGKVGGIAEPDSSLEFVVPAPRAGRVPIYIRAGNGNPTSCTQQVSVNGAAPATVEYPSTSAWDVWEVRALGVPLRAGSNTLTFATGDCTVEIDSIQLAFSP